MSALRVLFLSFPSLISTSVSAVERFAFHDVVIEDIAVFWRGGWTVLQLKLAGLHASTGCAPTDTHKIVSNWTNDTFTNNWSFRLALIMSAHAQQLPVDIQIKDHSCDTNAAWDDWGAPVGLGWELEGIRIRQPGP